MPDAQQRLALEAVIRLAAATEVELFHDKARGPLAHVLLQMRADAALALSALVKVDPEDPKEIRRLQNEIQRFLDTLGYVAKQIGSGWAETELREADREQIREMIEDESDPEGDGE